MGKSFLKFGIYFHAKGVKGFLGGLLRLAHARWAPWWSEDDVNTAGTIDRVDGRDQVGRIGNGRCAQMTTDGSRPGRTIIRVPLLAQSRTAMRTDQRLTFRRLRR